PAKTCIRRVAKLVCTKRFSKYRFYCRIQTSGLTFVRNSHMSIADFLQQKKREKAEANLKEALDFLAENGKKPSVQVTSSGLQYEVLSQSDQQTRPTAAQSVTVHYEG